MNKLFKPFVKRASEEIKPDEDLILLTVFSSIVGAFGIALNNPYLIIGTMLISPFFDPIISFGVFTIAEEWKKALNALLSLVIITGITIVVSTVSFFSFSFIIGQYSPYFELPTEFLAYFLVAGCLGSVGALLWIWPRTSNTSAGISVAISLVPPLINAGRGVVEMDGELVKDSLISSGLNMLGITLGVVLVMGVRYRMLKIKDKVSRKD